MKKKMTVLDHTRPNCYEIPTYRITLAAMQGIRWPTKPPPRDA